MIALIISICLTLSLAIMAGSFYWGYKVGVIKKLSDDNAIFLEQADKQVKEMQEAINQLEYALEQAQAKPKIETPRAGGWNPLDPLNSSERR